MILAFGVGACVFHSPEMMTQLCACDFLRGATPGGCALFSIVTMTSFSPSASPMAQSNGTTADRAGMVPPPPSQASSWLGRAELKALRQIRRVGKTKQKPTVLFVHGGGFIEGFDDNHQRMVWALDKLIGVNVLTVEYPVGSTADVIRPVIDAALADAAAVHGPVVMVGDSAGANLAMAAALNRPDDVGALVLMCPWLDVSLACVDPAAQDLLLSVAVLQTAAVGFAGGRELTDPFVSPLFDERQLPPTLVVSGGQDVLAVDAWRLNARDEVQLVHVPSGFHDFPAAAVSPSGLRAWRAIRSFLRANLPSGSSLADPASASGLFPKD